MAGDYFSIPMKDLSQYMFMLKKATWNVNSGCCLKKLR